MLKKKIYLYILLFISVTSFSQVKIGDQPDEIDPSSILELKSNDKVLVITRLTSSQINTLTPLEGALVYNTDVKCIYFFNGTSWENLCNSSTISVTTATTPPNTNNMGDVWVNSSDNNSVSIWDGSNWISVTTNPKRGSGAPTLITAPSSNPGDIYVDTLTGNLYTYNGTNWINQNANLNASNGLTKNTSDIVQLGGDLIQPTTINTDTNNTLSINGLPQGDNTTDEIVTVNTTTGQLRKTNASNLFKEEITEIVAIEGQVQFSPTIAITDSKKVNVYRNGVRIDFTVLNNSTIQVEAEAICYQGDQIRIVQFY